MATAFLTFQERSFYEATPPIDESILRQHFYLNQNDKAFLIRFNGELNRVAIAVQIGLLRFLGFIPSNWHHEINRQSIDFIHKQLYKTTPILSLSEYGKWGKIKTDHFQQILKHIGYRKWQPLIDEPLIEKWLIEIGMEHDNGRFLLDMLCQKLHQEKSTAQQSVP